jgi:hypothetical protein
MAVRELPPPASRRVTMGRGGAVARVAVTVLMGVGVLVMPGRATTAALARSPDCPSPPITAEKLFQVMDDGSQLACFGGSLLTFRTYVPPTPEGIGWVDAWSISPGWLDDNSGSMWLLGTTPSRLITAWVPPALGRCSPGANLASCPFRWFIGRWTTVSAHFDGPVARTCRFAEHPPGPGFTTRDAVENCRAKLIVLAVGSVAPPDTATATSGHEDGVPPAALLAVAAVALASRLLGRRLLLRRA